MNETPPKILKGKKLAGGPLAPIHAGGEMTFERFVGLIRTADFTKIEKTLSLPSPSEGFRDWLIKEFWCFYRNSGEQHAGNSRKILKDELQKSALLAANLKLSTSRLLQSREAALALSDFVGWQAWQPMHSSGIPLIGLLDEFAKRVGSLADTLSDDAGGPRDKTAFYDLLIILGHYYRAFMHDRGRPIRGAHFFQFAAAVRDMLRDLKIGEGLPADAALRKRMYRLNAKRPPSKMT